MAEKHLVCTGATCKCQFGKAPSKLKVLTQKKHYINDVDGKEKLMATHKELGQPFEPPFFGSCSKMNNNPCTVNVTEWDGFYPKVTLQQNGGGHPLLEDSKATCPIGSKGCISIVWHGQTTQPTAANLTSTDPFLMAQINPLVGLNKMQAVMDKQDE